MKVRRLMEILLEASPDAEVMWYNSELTKELFKENSFPEKMIIYGKLKLLNELKEEILEIINEDGWIK